MKIATFNIQNLFHRDKGLLDKSIGEMIPDWITELDTLMQKSLKSVAEQNRIRELSFLIGFENIRTRPYALLRRKAGFLYIKGIHHFTNTKANYLTDWNGWIALQTLPIRPQATENKAKVIADVNADILLLQEIEDRASLEEFNQKFLPKFDCKPYKQSFVIQNNNTHGLETAVLLRNGYTLSNIKTHIIGVFNDQFQHVLEYEIVTPSIKKIWLVSIYLAKQNVATKIDFSIRKSQVINITKVYKKLISEGKKNVIITGTFNAHSYCDSLSPLLQNTDVKDITKHLSFEVECDEGNDANYFRLGAYQLGVNIKQKDYMLLSPALFKAMTDSGINRKAIYPNKRPQWTVYKSVTNKHTAASEHPVVWGTIEF